MSTDSTATRVKKILINRPRFLKNFFKTHQLVIPFFIMMIFLVLPINLFLLMQMTSKISFKQADSPQLVTMQARPTLALGKFLDGSFQKDYETWVNDHNPLKSMFTNFNNQFYYSLFSKSLMADSSIVIGKKGYLYEKDYIIQYVNANKIPFTQEKTEKWAANLQELADFFTHRGQQFIYVITPSKAAYYPEYIPNEYTKVVTNARPGYFLKIEALKKIHVPYFDASEYILSKKEKSYGNLLFIRGGTHWTMLGAAFTTKKILALISQQTKKLLPPLSFSYTLSTNPHGVDMDLLYLCKLLFPPRHYAVPHVSFKALENPVPLKVAIVGGSFTNFFVKLFIEANYFSQIDHYYYLILNHYRHSKEGITLLPMIRNDPASYQAILEADIVILEENEIIPYWSNHFDELYFRLLGKHMR